MIRNPYTPQLGVRLPPTKYLEIYLRFRIWESSYPVSNLMQCQVLREELYNSGVCCLEHTRESVESRQLQIAGCGSGVFTEPRGYRRWYELATARLAELEQGIDRVDEWTQTFESRHDLQEWIFDKSVSREKKPGFSLYGYKLACHKHGYKPEFALVEKVFGLKVSFLIEYWKHDKA